MSVEKFEELLKLVKPKITKKWTYMREPICRTETDSNTDVSVQVKYFIKN